MCFRYTPLSLALRVPHQGLSRNVTIGLSQCVTKPSPFSLKNLYLYLNSACSLPEFIVADFVYGKNEKEW